MKIDHLIEIDGPYRFPRSTFWWILFCFFLIEILSFIISKSSDYRVLFYNFVRVFLFFLLLYIFGRFLKFKLYQTILLILPIANLTITIITNQDFSFNLAINAIFNPILFMFPFALLNTEKVPPVISLLLGYLIQYIAVSGLFFFCVPDVQVGLFEILSILLSGLFASIVFSISALIYKPLRVKVLAKQNNDWDFK